MQEYKRTGHATDDFMEAVFDGDIPTLEALIVAGQNINATNQSGQTALHIAILSTKLSRVKTITVIEKLLSAKADINFGNNNNDDTPLHTVIREWGADIKLVKFLVSKGAKIYEVNNNLETPYGLSNGEVRDWFNQQEKIIERQLSTQRKFFAKIRAKPGKVAEISAMSDEYKQGYTNYSKTVDITRESGRRLVMAESDALKDMSHPYQDGAKPEIKNVMQANGWLIGREDQFGFWSGGEVLLRRVDAKLDGKLEIKVDSRHKPVPGHIGNFWLAADRSQPRRHSDADLGKYGRDQVPGHPAVRYTGVLAAIYEVTARNEDAESEKVAEQSLAKLLLDCLKNGLSITTQRLKSYKLYYYKDNFTADRRRVIKLLNSLATLTGVKEIVRRMYGSRLDLPLSVAYVKGLKLVAAGHLSMEDMFGKDAPYGIPTAEGFAVPAVREKAKDKLRALNALYAEKMEDVPTTKEDFHQLLLEGYGGASDTDGDEYSASDDEGIGLAGMAI